MHPTQTIIQKLIEKDEYVTRHFFFEKCRPLFVSVINKVFSYKVDYDEFVNELYLHLMENDAARLRQFEGRSTIYQWLKVVAIRYFIAKKSRMIEDGTNDTLLNEAQRSKGVSNEGKLTAKVDVRRLLQRVRNQRYVYVIKKLVLEEAEPKEIAKIMGVTLANLYNIKKRAMAAVTEIALREFSEYENGI